MNPSRPRINNLYIDLNGIFYHALEATHQKETEVSSLYMAEVLRYIDMLVQFTRPTDTLMIAVDGPAPFAKACQQRSRRFLAVRNSTPNSFDRTVFSPGSQFMHEIHEHLLAFIEEKTKTDSAWMKPQVVYSSVYCPGEGEAKILNFVRESRLKEGWNPNMTHVIYSNDADVIFLSLQTHEPYFMVLRECPAPWTPPRETHEGKKSAMRTDAKAFEFIHLSLVREYMSKDFGVEGEELEKVIDDFVAIAFLIGNDFVREFEDIRIQKGGFNTVVDVYKSVLRDIGGHLVVDGRYNKEFQYAFLKEVALELSPDNSKRDIAAMKEIYRKRLQMKFLTVPATELPNLIQRMSHSVLEAFTWVLQYYSSGCPSWTWSYPFDYSVPLVFVLDYVREYEPHFELGAPVRPFLQQLIILPPQSAKWMASPMQPLMFPPSPIARFYPTTFEVDQVDAKCDWRNIPLIPSVDLEEVRKAYEENISLVSEEEMCRNAVEKARVYHGPETRTEIDIGLGSRFLPVLLATELPVGVPTFTSRSVTFSEELVPVVCLDAPSKYPSIVVRLDQTPAPFRTLDAAKELLNKTVVFDWPYVRTGLVTAVTDGGPNVITCDGSTREAKSPAEVSAHLKTTSALEVGPIQFLFEILEYRPANREQTDFEYSSAGFWYPGQFVAPSEGARILELFQPAQTVPPAVGSYVVFARGFHEGSKGQILAQKSESVFDVRVFQKTKPNISKIIEDDAQAWIHSSQVCKRFGISFPSLRLVLTNLYLQRERANIAFALFTYDNRHVLRGCAKMQENDLYLAKFAVERLGEYFKRAGNLLKVLKAGKTGKLTSDVIFSGSDAERRQEIDGLCQWLRENAPAAHHPLVPSGMRCLAVPTIKKLEAAIEGFKAVVSEKDVTDVSIDVLSWPTKHDTTTSPILPPLGQRIVSIACSGPVPYGATGTVVAVNPRGHDVFVMFDEPLPCGTSLDELFTAPRGLPAKPHDLVLID